MLAHRAPRRRPRCVSNEHRIHEGAVMSPFYHHILQWCGKLKGVVG